MSGDPDSTSPIVLEPQEVPGRSAMPVEGRAGADAASGKDAFVSWGARSDVGLVRGHNEDSFLLRAPLFVVCDGMGGHAAGEVASAIAVDAIAAKAPSIADDTLLGAAVEAANVAVIEGAENGQGKPGMGCTASCAVIKDNHMAVAHVGDSRIYLLRQGSLVRVTHDHSYVEELVDAGEITADEARTHPSRSVITRALGSDPDMYADHFTVEVRTGDRVILCSDGLSSMVEDREIEALAVSSATPQAAADKLVSAALTAGGSDNVTVIVVDVLDDGQAAKRRRALVRSVSRVVLVAVCLVAAVAVAFAAFTSSSYYLGDNDGTVAIYRGVNGHVLGIPLSQVLETTTVQTDDLPQAVQQQLAQGIPFQSEEEARGAVESYRDQIDAEKTKAAQTADAVSAEEGADASGSDASGSGQDAADATGTDSAGAAPAEGASATDATGGEGA